MNRLKTTIYFHLILKEDDTNPFLQENINEDDVAEATPGFLMIDSDQEGDEDIDI